LGVFALSPPITPLGLGGGGGGGGHGGIGNAFLTSALDGNVCLLYPRPLSLVGNNSLFLSDRKPSEPWPYEPGGNKEATVLPKI
jgi:hypothetical protein